MTKEQTTPETPTFPSTARSLPIALIGARESVMAPIRAMLAEAGITEQQWRVLRVLSEFGPQDATEVSQKTYLLLSSLTRIIQTMTQKGLLTRSPHETDRRRLTLEITPAGQKILDDNLHQGIAIVNDVRAKLGAEQYELLLDLLATVSEP